MKRDCDGEPVANSACFNVDDFQGKVRALVDFTTESCSYAKYRDDFLVYIEPDNADQAKRNIRFHWYCQKFTTKKDTFADDNRDHETVLSKHFKCYNVLIQKYDYGWEVVVSSKPPGVLRVSLPSSATPS